MIERKDILSIPYLKKSAFTGSFVGMRFRFTQKISEEGEQLEVTAWEGPYNYEVTSPAKMQKKLTAFSEQGILEGIDWLNEIWQSDSERFRRAASNW